MTERDLETRIAALEQKQLADAALLLQAQAYATVSQVLTEQLVGSIAAGRDDGDAWIIELHQRARARLKPIAQLPENRTLANEMFAQLEAVLLHAAQSYRTKN